MGYETLSFLRGGFVSLRTRPAGWAAGLLLSVASLGCGDPDPAMDAAVTDIRVDMEGNDSGTPDAGPSMSSRQPPTRPAADTEGTSADEFVVALRDVVLDQDGERWRTIGFDLDRLDTQAPDLNTECRPPDNVSDPLADGDEGIDNVFGDRLYPLISIAAADLQGSARSSHAAGFGTLLVHVEDWNGDDDDPRVVLSLTPAAGGSSDPIAEFDSEFNPLDAAGDAAPAPAWDGADSWYSRDDALSFNGVEDVPTLRDDNGYVRDGVAVMRIPDGGGITFLLGRDRVATLKLTDGTLLTVVRPGPDFGNTTVAGRWSIIHLLETAESVGICSGTPEKAQIDAQLQVLADIRSTPGTGGEDVLCDSLSFAATFSGVRGTHVGTGPSFPLPTPCAD